MWTLCPGGRLSSIYFLFCFGPKERAQVVLPEKELSELLDDSPNIFRNQIITGTLTEQIHYLVVESLVP